MRRIFSIIALLFLFSSQAAQGRVCTPPGEACNDFLTCCEGSCQQGVCQDDIVFFFQAERKEAPACSVKDASCAFENEGSELPGLGE